MIIGDYAWEGQDALAVTEARGSTAQGGLYSNPTTNTRTQQLKMNTVVNDTRNVYKGNYKCKNYKYVI